MARHGKGFLSWTSDFRPYLFDISTEIPLFNSNRSKHLGWCTTACRGKTRHRRIHYLLNVVKRMWALSNLKILQYAALCHGMPWHAMPCMSFRCYCPHHYNKLMLTNNFKNNIRQLLILTISSTDTTNSKIAEKKKTEFSFICVHIFRVKLFFLRFQS